MGMSEEARAAYNEYMRKYREANKEKLAAYNRARYEKNREKFQESNRAYYAAHKEEIKERHEAYWERKAAESIGTPEQA